jgi:ATP-binding cassette subfamily B (MDR/TAP) protein 10
MSRTSSLLRSKPQQVAELSGKKTTSKSTVPKLSDIKRLFQLAEAEKWKLAGAMGCLVVSSAVAMSVPFCIGKVIDMLYKSEDGLMMDNLNKFCGVLLCVFLVGGLANFGRVYSLQLASQRMVKRLREMLFSRIMRQEVAFFDKTKTGELVNRLSADTSVVAQSLSQNISDGLRSIFQALGGIGMMTYVSAKLTLISMGIVPPIAIGSIIYGRYLRKITKNVQDSLANATHVAEERVASIRTVRAFAHEEKECKAYSQGVEEVLKLGYKEALARGIFFGFTGFSGNVVVISVFYFGGMMMLDSSITVGDLSAFLLYAAYAGISMSGLTTFYSEMNRSIAASHRIWQLIDRRPAIESSPENTTPRLKLHEFDGNLQFNQVSFSYPSRSDMPIFSQLDLNIPAGQVTAVVGPSGSGKSTLSALLLRFYDPLSGYISLDGHDLRHLDPNWLRSSIGTVSQEPVLFSTSIAENIAYGADRPELVSMEQIHDAAQKANAVNFITSFPSGFDTLVGERGVMLSGGQRQRIAIARAILKNPKILILDEATSALDAESEYLVQEALERLMVGKTVLVIAHRLSTIKSANTIIVLSDGQAVESGTYLQLMTMKDGMFRKLVERQTIVT